MTERISTVEAARIMGCSVPAARKRLRAAKVDTQKVPGLRGGVRLLFLKSDTESYVHKVRQAKPSADLRIEFRDAYCRWHASKYASIVDELHVESKNAEVKKGLREALKSGGVVISAGRSYGQTRYKVLREVGSVFVLANEKDLE